MSLIGLVEGSGAMYKKARAILFNNSEAVPVMHIYEDDVVVMGDKAFSNQSGEYTVPYSPDIEIPLPDEVLALLANIQIAKALHIDGLMGILLAVYGFGRTYQPPVVEQPEIL